MHTAYISHPLCRQHDVGPWHPEAPERLTAIQDHLIATGLDPLLRHFDAPEVTREQLLRVHDADYLDALNAQSPQLGVVHVDPDTAMNPHTLAAARRAAGAVVQATDLVLAGEVQNAFCAVRPPGHHAERRRAMGFCFYNNVAVGAAHALASGQVARVAVVDFDVHHGNGTEQIFHHHPDVLMCSSFQHPFYPYTDLNFRAPNVIHAPIAAGLGSEAFRVAVEDEWLPALDRFAPQMIFISAGFDGHRDDELAQLCLTEDDYAWVTRVIHQLAAHHAHGRIVSVLEGGYDLPALARSVRAHLDILLT
ncbi:MAG: histone deacetylase family protein [Immundisolibacter sp.]|uniref:histone deacetylase family protein n=1 Tax=Immundisolibacter sp. TaxID=1934948 RepID=UPI00356A89AD